MKRTIQPSNFRRQKNFQTTYTPSWYESIVYLQPLCVRNDQHRRCSTNTEDGNRKITALAVFKDLKYLGSAPTASLVVGLGGLIPFISAPAFMLVAGYYSPFVAYGQVAYGASILSFLGGIRWGLTLPEEGGVRPSWFNIGYSVTPSLIAWVGLLFPVPLALCVMMTGLGGSLYMDLTLYGYPAWFRALRFLLTLFAILSLWTTLVLRFTLYTKEDKEKRKVNEPPKEVKEEPKVTVTKILEGPGTDLLKSAGKKVEKLTEDVVLPKLDVGKEKLGVVIAETRTTEKQDVEQAPEDEVKELKDAAETFGDFEDAKELKE